MTKHTAKTRFLLTLLAILLISGAAFYAVSVPRHMGEAGALGGAFDLTGADFDNLIYPLDGEWEFYFGKLYAPEDFTASSPPEGGTLIAAPPSWTSAGYPMQGHATYRLTIKTADDAPLMLHIPEIMTAAIVYVNGEKVHEAGGLGAGAFRIALRNDFISFTPQGGETEIVVQAARYLANGRGGLNYSVHVGAESLMLRDAMLRRVLLAAVVGMMLMMALYHLVLFLFNRRELIYLWYVLYVLTTALRMSMETNGLIQLLAPDGVTDMLFRAYMSCFAGQLLFLTLFTLEAFRLPYWPRANRRRVVYIVSGVIFAVNFWVYLSGPVAQSYLPTVALLPLAVVTVAAGRRLWVKREEYAGRFMGLYIIALLFFLVWGTLAKGLGDNALFVPAVLSNLFMAMAQAVMLSRTYADALAQEQFLLADNAALERVNRLKTDLMNTISHEMRTPLAVMSGYTELISRELKKSGAAQQTVRDLDAITSEAERLSNMVSNMREMAFSHGEPARKAPMAPGGVVEQVARLYRPMLERKGTELTVRIEDDLPDIFGSAEEITQVLFNLLSNAGKYAESAAIALDARRVGDYVEITVVDTGKGIAPDFLPRAFERYQSGESGGTGVGLAVCKEIVESHGGGIALESELGKGTTARVRFPVYKGGDADA
ncbi:MAG: sensor histidine kinase [Gracilibacteraceae bacterium]|jgi:signal transduction histidine kinase|nr:sensor histidine kinase [Gracilibacteraceae bacterium]